MYSGFHTGFFGGGGKNGVTPPRECEGMLPQEHFLKFTCSEAASGGFWGLKKTGD